MMNCLCVHSELESLGLNIPPENMAGASGGAWGVRIATMYGSKRALEKYAEYTLKHRIAREFYGTDRMNRLAREYREKQTEEARMNYDPSQDYHTYYIAKGGKSRDRELD